MKKIQNKIKDNIFILLIYFVCSIVFSYPLIKNILNTIPGWPMDGFNYMWNIDTFWNGIFNLHNPFQTTRIFYPIGANLISHTYAPFISVIGLPFLKVLPLYMNILIIFSFVIAAFSFYKLSQFFTKNKYVSVLSGFVYGFSPIMVSYLISQHYYFLFASSLMPIIPLVLLQGKNNHSSLYKSIILLWIIFFIDYYIFIVSTILFLIIIVSLLKAGQYKISDLYKPFILAGLLPLFLYILFFLRQNSLGITAYKENSYPGICNLNLANVLKPSPFNNLLSKYKNDFNIDYDTPSYYLGYTVLFFSLIGVFTSFKKWRYRLFIVFGILIFLLSLGPNIRYNDNTSQLTALPFRYFSKLPYMNMVDCPKRFIVGFQLMLSLMFSTGFIFFLQTVKNKGLKIIIIFIITLLIIVEYSSFNIPVTDVYIPNVYKNIKNNSDDKTILELPSGITESKRGWGYDWSISGLHLRQLYWQTYYNKPRLGGYLSRVPDSIYNTFENEPIIKYLFDLSTLNSKEQEKQFTRNEVESLIKKYNLGYIVFSPNQRQDVFIKTAKKLFKENIIYETRDDRGYYLIELINF